LTAKKSNNPDQLESEAALIEHIYSIALEPQGYDDFMELWDVHVSSALKNLEEFKQHQTEDQPKLISPSIEKHFEIGFRLLQEMGRNSPATLFESEQNTNGEPAILIDKNAKCVWFNGAADRCFQLGKLKSAFELSFRANGENVLRDMIGWASTEAPPAKNSHVIQLHSTKEDKSYYLIAKPIIDRSGESLIHLQHAMPRWKNPLNDLLISAFSISEAEIEIAKELMDGLTIAEIAEQRNKSAATVRTQVKSLLSKTGTKSQTDLVRLLLSLIRVIENEPDNELKQPSSSINLIARPSNRTIPVREFGPSNGRPVIFIHGMLDGCSITRQIEGQLEKYNIRLIAPERPSFGSSSSAPGPIETATMRFASDVEAVMNELSLKNAVLLGHMAGSIYTFSTAAHLGSRITGILNVSGGVPIINNIQLSSMSTRQRLVAYTAKYTPKLLPFILRAGIRQLDFGGEEDFMNALYENAPHDQRALLNKEIFRVVCDGYHFAISQGYKAFEIDSYHAVRNWSDVVQQSTCPIMLVHGRHDIVIAATSIEIFAERFKDRTKLVMVEDAGQLVLYAKPELVFEQLDKFIGI